LLSEAASTAAGKTATRKNAFPQCRNVKRWRAGDQIERWVGSGLLVAERQFRKVQGYREIPALLTALANAVSKKTVVEQGKVA
jgi:hypothetical protein